MNDTSAVQIAHIEERLIHVENDLKEVKTSQKEILKELSRAKGFFGGIIFLGGCIATAIVLIIKYVKGGP